jgi:plastocyanin
MHAISSPLIVVSLSLGAFLPGSAAAEDGATIVVAKSSMCAPDALTGKAGSTVTWTNHDQEPRTVASDSGLFRSGALDTNGSFFCKFDKPGTYHYVCTIHPQMVGTIVMQ